MNSNVHSSLRAQGLPWAPFEVQASGQPHSRGQGAIEYLLIIGAAILVVAIVVIAITTVLSQGQNQSSSGIKSATTAYDSLKEGSGEFIKINNSYYLKSAPIVSGCVVLI